MTRIDDTPPPCLHCGCPWDSCLIHNEFCCDACAHFDPPTPTLAARRGTAETGDDDE